MQEGLKRCHTFFGHDLATVVLMEAVGHDAVETGQAAHRGNRLVQQGGDVLAVAQLAHAAMGEQREVGQITRRRPALFELHDQPVVVGMNDRIEHRFSRRDFDAEWRAFLPGFRVAESSGDGFPDTVVHARSRNRPSIPKRRKPWKHSMHTPARVGQPALKVKSEKQAVGLDVPRDVNRLAVAVVEVDCGEVDARAGHCMTDAARGGGNLVECAAIG